MSLTDVEMRPVAGLDGYWVTEDGRVFSAWSRGGANRIITGELREIRGTVAGHGYHMVGIGSRKAGTQANRLVHRLVLEAFVGPCPEGMVARHINGNMRDNHSSNLEWGTPQDNSNDGKRLGEFKTGDASPRSAKNRRRTEEQLTRLFRCPKCNHSHRRKSLAKTLGRCQRCGVAQLKYVDELRIIPSGGE